MSKKGYSRWRRSEERQWLGLWQDMWYRKERFIAVRLKSSMGFLG